MARSGLAIGGKRAGASKQAVPMSPLEMAESSKIVLPPGSNEVGRSLGVSGLGKRFVVGVGTNEVGLVARS